MKHATLSICIAILIVTGISGWWLNPPERGAAITGWGLSVSVAAAGILAIRMTFARSSTAFLGAVIGGILFRFLCLLGGGYYLVRVYNMVFVPYIITAMIGYVCMQIIEIKLMLNRLQTQREDRT